MIGFSVGVGLAAIVAAATDVKKGRIYAINGSMAFGSLVGLMVAGIVRLDAERRDKKMAPEALAASLAIGSGAGLILSFIFDDEDFEDHDDAEEEAGTSRQSSRRRNGETAGSFRLGAAPTEGGAMIVGTGTF
jgi:hypothetical protein